MLATCGGDGRSNSEDEVDRESSAVQSVAVFFPVTDLLNLGDSTENPGDGGPPMSFGEGFGPGAKEMPKWKEIGRALSPIYHIGEEMPPVFIVHGNADTLVPLDQSVRFRDAAANLGKEVELLIRPDKGHGWASMIGDLWLFADWFDATLGEKVRR
jgi:dipeptidyl aminopeptidase/acylaminoacyl peptidase